VRFGKKKGRIEVSGKLPIRILTKIAKRSKYENYSRQFMTWFRITRSKTTVFKKEVKKIKKSTGKRD